MRALSRFLRSPVSPGPFLLLFSPAHADLRGWRSAGGSGTALSILPSLGKEPFVRAVPTHLAPRVFLKGFLLPLKTSGPKDCSFRSLAR